MIILWSSWIWPFGWGGNPLTPFSAPSSESSFSAPSSESSLLLHQNLLSLLLHQNLLCSFIRIFSLCSFIRIFFLCAFVRIFFVPSSESSFSAPSSESSFADRPVARLLCVCVCVCVGGGGGGGGGSNWLNFGTFYDYAWIILRLDLAIFLGGGTPPPPPAMSVLIYISKFTYFRAQWACLQQPNRLINIQIYHTDNNKLTYLALCKFPHTTCPCIVAVVCKISSNNRQILVIL